MHRTGAERTDVDPVWPSGLLRPTTKLLYLDLNHWIALAKANAGHKDGGGHEEALARMRSLPDTWALVIGMPLIMEITGIRRRHQLLAISELIEELSKFACIIPLTSIVPLELDAALTAFGSPKRSSDQIPLVGRGVLRAMGMMGGIVFRDPQGNDVTDAARQESGLSPEEFDRRLFEAERKLDRSVLQGPENAEEERALVADGWNPAATRKVAEKRALQEREQAARLASHPKWRRGRLRDVVATRYLTLEFGDEVASAQQRHRVLLGDLLRDVNQLRRFTDSMPAADTWITLRTAKYRNPDSRWLPNDIFDIDALAVAAPYCDVVLTERHSIHVLRQAGVPERYGTSMFPTLGEFVIHLDALERVE